MQQQEMTIPSVAEQQHYVIPLSIQKDGDAYLVGNADMGDFYQFPDLGVQILKMFQSGHTTASIKSWLATEQQDMVDVDDFVRQMTDIGFIHPESDRQTVQTRFQQVASDTRRTFNVDPRIARAIFSVPAGLCYLAIVGCAIGGAIIHPDLRINFGAFYTETNRTALLVILMGLSLVQVAMHETGHMLAAARYGIKSKYGVGHRLWAVVAESDLTGILALPRSQRYLPMLAGLLVDIVCASLLTIVIGLLLRQGASAFTIQVCQALVLEILIGMSWQFNIFVKTDIYFVLCNYFGYPDLDQAARRYLRDLTWRATLGFLGGPETAIDRKHVVVLRAFALIWLLGRMMSLFILFGVFLPTMAQYLIAAAGMLRGPPASIWLAVDTTVYVCITLTMLGIGIYMWLKGK